MKNGIACISFSPDGKRLACADVSTDHYVAVYDTRKGTKLGFTKGGPNQILDIVWTDKDNFAAVGTKYYGFWNYDVR